MPVERNKHVISESEYNTEVRQAELQLAITKAIELVRTTGSKEYGHIDDRDIICVLTRMAAERAKRMPR